MGFIDDPLWRALAAMRIEPEGASLTFVKRLARENGWSRAYAEQVVEEYRRFLYLAATGDAPVTPSDQIDQAWHLHLAYTRHYWEELCARIIGRPLHHGPTAGGGAEGRKYRNLYGDTLARYRDTFGSEPPADIWPPTEQRFGSSYQWVDRSRNFVLPRRTVSMAGLAGGAVLLAACTALAADKAASTGGSLLDTLFDFMTSSSFGFFGVMIFLFVGMIVIGNIVDHLRGKGSYRQRHSARNRQAQRKRRDNRDSGGSSDSSDGWSAGGSGAAAAGGAAFAAGGGDFGGSGADGDWDGGDSSDSGCSSDSGGDSGCSSGCSGCGGGCGGD